MSQHTSSEVTVKEITVKFKHLEMMTTNDVTDSIWSLQVIIIYDASWEKDGFSLPTISFKAGFKSWINKVSFTFDKPRWLMFEAK